MQNLYKVSNVFVDRMFQVPDYQRGYAWEEVQWNDFLEDLELLPEGREHYTGTLILHHLPHHTSKMDEADRSYSVVDVVDGQQRLTTIVLLLEAIRREMARFDRLQALITGIQTGYISVRDFNGQPMPKLTLNRDSHDFFYNTVLDQNPSVEGPKIRSHQLLLSAKQRFSQYLSQKQKSLNGNYADWLVNLYTKVTQQLTFIVYTVSTEADAGVLFETMNNRGKQITELEKVKNYLLYLSSKLELPDTHNLPSAINATWKLIFEHLIAAGLGTTDNEDQLLRVHWLMVYDPQAKNWQGSRSIKERFNLRVYQNQHKLLLQHLQTYIDTLSNAVIAYCDIYNPTHSDAFNAFNADTSLRQKIASTSEKLPRLGTVAQFLPLLIAGRLKYPADAAKYLALVSLCEKFAFRVYKLSSWRPYTGLAKLYQLGHGLFRGDNFQGVLDELTRLLLSYCSDKRFRDEFQLDPEENDWYYWPGLKYFLYEYEEHLARTQSKEVKMLWSMVESKPNTIEHILPQQPASGSDWLKLFSKKARDKYTHDLGNLTLTQDNSILSNKSFADKKGKVNQRGCYANSIIFMERALVLYNRWTEKELLARRKEMVDWAIQNWYVETPLTSPPVAVVQPHDKVKAIEHLADQKGVGDEFRAILEAATNHGLHPRPHKLCVVYAPPSDRTRALFAVWPKLGNLEVGVWHSQFPEFFKVSGNQVKDILGPDEWQYITDTNVDTFTASLDQLFEEIGKG